MSGVPDPVWPEQVRPGKLGTDTLPLKSGHVASQVQRLTLQLEGREERARQYITSISVESDDREEEVVTGRRQDDTDSDTVLYQNVTYHNERSQATEAGARKTRTKTRIRPNSSVSVLPPQPLPGLTSRAWPGNSLNYSERGQLTGGTPAMLRTPDRASDRCFAIRHKVMSPIGEELEKDTRMNDSIVTSSLLMMTSLSPTDTSESGQLKRPSSNVTVAAEEEKEEVTTSTGLRLEVVGPRLESVLNPSRHASTLSRAVSQAKRSFRGSRRSSIRHTVSQRHRSLGRRRERSRAGSGGVGGGAEAMRELWQRTGMKTNGRKLLIESEEEEAGRSNGGYQSDGSEVSVPRVRGIRKLPQLGHRKTGSQSSTTSYDSVQAGRPPTSRPVLVRSASGESGASGAWRVRGGARVHGMSTVDLDAVQLDGDSDCSAKHVRFSSRNTQYSKFRNEAARPAARQPGVWERYYGTGGVEAGLGAARNLRNGGQSKVPGREGDLVMERITSGLIRSKERKRRGLRCFFKTFCFLLLLTSFLLVIVAVSIFLSRGRTYFGSLEV